MTNWLRLRRSMRAVAAVTGLSLGGGVIARAEVDPASPPPAEAPAPPAAGPASPLSPPPPDPASQLRGIYTEALVHGTAYEHLSELVSRYPGRLSGSTALDGAVDWAARILGGMGLDQVALQAVAVPHWERGEPEKVDLIGPHGPPTPLAALALGGSGATPDGGLSAEVVTVRSLPELAALGRAGVEGRIVFFDRPMDPATVIPATAYGAAGDQRNRGPAAAAAQGAVAALVRSLTHAHDDVPHTGQTVFAPGNPPIPAAALSPQAADRLEAALAADPHARVHLELHCRRLPDVPSANVIGEIRGREFPNQILVVGGHLDSWDIAPGAHDDGSGVVQSIEVLRIFSALGIKPRHTLRCVLFVNEENGLHGGTAYAAAVRAAPGRHLFAVETDNGGFQPRGFSVGSTQGDAAGRAAKWLPLFEPYGITFFRAGAAGADVSPLLLQGVTVAELTPDSQRYFDLHHTRRDGLDQVNPRELELGAAALASLLWLVDVQGL